MNSQDTRTFPAEKQKDQSEQIMPYQAHLGEQPSTSELKLWNQAKATQIHAYDQLP